jgi:hypothetical protein
MCGPYIVSRFGVVFRICGMALGLRFFLTRRQVWFYLLRRNNLRVLFFNLYVRVKPETTYDCFFCLCTYVLNRSVDISFEFNLLRN